MMKKSEKQIVASCELRVAKKNNNRHRDTESVIRKLLTVFILACCCLLVTVVYASSVDETVGRIQKKYEEIQDMQGGFSQTSYLKDLDRTEKYEGEFFIKKPSNMKWAYLKPRDEEVTIRNADTWIYKKSEKQAFKTTFSRSAYRQLPLALLGSLEDLRSDYDITMVDKDTLELIPIRQMGFIKKIFLAISPGDFPVKRIEMLDTQNNQIIIKIKNVKINSGLKDSFFIFKAPPGVEVFDLTQ